jgi:pimeloyl-ACP methyl ester carboxylesterase
LLKVKEMSSAEFDPGESIEDRVGLDRAYDDDRRVYMEGDSMFVAGTSSLGDVMDDVALPFALTKGTQRYIDAERVLKANPKIRRIVGHSLGGAVALELQKEHPELKSRTYGAPVVSMSSGERYKSAGDPVAALDFGAKTTAPTTLNPHSYQDLAAKVHTPGPGVGAGSYDLNGVGACPSGVASCYTEGPTGGGRPQGEAGG